MHSVRWGTVYFGSVSCTGPTVDPVSFMHISQGLLLCTVGVWVVAGHEMLPLPTNSILISSPHPIMAASGWYTC